MKKKEKNKFNLSKRRTDIINSINSVVDIFTSHSEKEFNDVINKGLKVISDSAGLDRIVIYRRFVIDDEIRFKQMYRWDKTEDGLVSLDEKLRILPKIPVLDQWIKILSENKCVKIRESEMSKDELAFLREFGVKSILIIPIFSYGSFWGGVALQDHTNDSYFDDGCIDLLFSAARLCANAIIRAEMSDSVNKAINDEKRREKMANILNKVAVKFLSQSQKSFEAMMTDGVRLIADMMDLDRVSVWRNIIKSDGMHASQVYRWDRESGGTTTITAFFEDVTYSQLAPSWEKILLSGNTINSPVSMLPESEAAMLKSFGVISLFVAPIFIGNDFWGFVLFEDRVNERYYEADLTEIMRSAAFLCANTVIREDMEQKLSNVHKFNRATLDAAPIGLTIIDDDLQVIDTNNATLEAFGCDRKEYIEHFYEFIPEFQPNGDKSYEKAVEIINRTLNGENFIVEWMHYTPRGNLIPFEVTMTRTKYMGKFVALCYQYDLRNIKKITAELKNQSELLKVRLEQQELISEISRSFVSSSETKPLVKEAITRLGHYFKVSSVVIYQLDYTSGEASITWQWSSDPEFSKRKKFNTREIIKTSFPERLYDCVTVPILSCVNTAVNSNDVFLELLAANICAFVCAPLYVEGHMWGFMAVEQNGKPRQWTDSEKNFVAATASTIAGAIMLDIYNTKLKDAVTKVTAASKAKSEFLSNMSHEMRTPMNAIINMTSIAQKTADVERKNYALEKIGEASTHLLGVINDILDMSKIEAKKFELFPVEFNFEKMLSRVVNVVNFRVEEKNQRFIVQIDKNIPQMLIGDDQRISQIITNLLGNAVKFTPENGYINLNTQFLGEKDGDCILQISITDTGIGISKEQQKHLFESFQQAESSTARNYGGTGLGLSISKNFVQMMGGEIWVESEHNKGSTFAFTIKVKRGKECESQIKTENQDAEDAINFKGRRILLVEDMEINREIVMMLLEPTHIEIDCAITGLQAVDMYIEEPQRYDIIFMDVHMPGMDGYEATRQIRSFEKKKLSDSKIRKRIPVVAMTANVFKEDIDNCLEAGMDDHVGKPLDYEVILEKLRIYIPKTESKLFHA